MSHRTTDPITSKKGFASIEEHRISIQNRIAYLLIGQELTASEIATALNMKRDSISPRINELSRQGVIVPSVERLCMTTGYNALAWRLKRPDEEKKEKTKLTPQEERIQNLILFFFTALASPAAR